MSDRESKEAFYSGVIAALLVVVDGHGQETSDIEEAHKLWGANCGPCSVAAILNLPVNDVRELMDGFEKRGYSNITHIKCALNRAGVKYRSIGAHLPTHGLVFIQWGGSIRKQQGNDA